MQSAYIKAGELLTKTIEAIDPTYEMAVRMIQRSGDSIVAPTAQVHLLDYLFRAT